MAQDNLTNLYSAIKNDYDMGTEADFRRHMLLPGKAGYENRRQLFQVLRQDNWDVGDTYEDFRDRLGLVAKSKVKAQPAAPAATQAVPKAQGAAHNQGNQTDLAERPGVLPLGARGRIKTPQKSEIFRGPRETRRDAADPPLQGNGNLVNQDNQGAAANQATTATALPDWANGSLLYQSTTAARDKARTFAQGQTGKVKKIVDAEHARRNQPVQKNAPGASMTVGQVEDDADAFIHELQGMADKGMAERNIEPAASSGPIMSQGQLLTESNLQGIQTEQNAANTEQDVIRYANGIDAGRKQRIMDMYGLETEQDWNNFVRQAAKGSVNRKMMADTKKVAGFMTSMMENSIVGKTVMDAGMPTRQRQMLSQANQEWAEGAHWYQTLPAQVGGLMLDAPLFQGFGAAANIATKGAAAGVRAAGGLKIFRRLNKAAGAAAPRLWSTIAGTAQKRLMQQQAGSLLYGMGRSGLTFGLYDATNDLVSQRYIGDTNALQMGEYGKDASIDWGEVGRSFAWGTLTGAATGVVGHGINRATRYLNGGKKALAEAGGLLAEAGTFAGVGLAREAAGGKHVTLDTAKDELIGSLTFLLGMKAPHAAMRTGGAIINNVGDMARGKATFANAMKGTFNDVFKAAQSRLNDTSLSLSQEEIRSLRRGGYVSADAKDTKTALRELLSVEAPVSATDGRATNGRADIKTHQKSEIFEDPVKSAPTRGRQGAQEKTPSLEEVNMSVALKYRGILADPDVPASLKTKLSRLVEKTPRTYMNAATAASIETREDGTATVRVTCPDKDGQPVLYMEMDFENEAEAKRWYQSVEGELEVNRMNSNGVAFMNSWTADVKSGVVNSLDEADRELYQSAALKRARDEELDPLEQQAIDEVDARVKSIIEGNGGMGGVVSAYEQANGLSRGTILEIQKKGQNITEQEQAIVSGFADYLNRLKDGHARNFEQATDRLLEAQRPADGGETSVPDDPQPVGTGKFGNIYNQFKGKAKDAIAFLTRKQSGEAVGVLHRDEIGDISLVWGNAPTDEKGVGLSHIIRKHINKYGDFKDVDDLAQKMEDVILNGTVRPDSPTSYSIEKDGYRVVVVQDENGNWVLTAYDYIKPKKGKNAAATITPGQPNAGAGAVTPGSSDAKLGNSSDIEPEERDISGAREAAREALDPATADTIDRLLGEGAPQEQIQAVLDGLEQAERQAAEEYINLAKQAGGNKGKPIVPIEGREGAKPIVPIEGRITRREAADPPLRGEDNQAAEDSSLNDLIDQNTDVDGNITVATHEGHNVIVKSRDEQTGMAVLGDGSIVPIGELEDIASVQAEGAKEIFNQAAGGNKGKPIVPIEGRIKTPQNQIDFGDPVKPAPTGAGNRTVPMREDGEPTAIPENERRILSNEEADDLLDKMEDEAEQPQNVPYDKKEWDKLFKNPISTPVGLVKMGEHQFGKLHPDGNEQHQDRRGWIGLIYATIARPNIIVEQYDPRDGVERDYKYVFVKSFLNPQGESIMHFASVTVKKGEMEAIITNHFKKYKDVKNLLKKGKLCFSSISPSGIQTETNRSSSSVTTSETDNNSGVSSAAKLPQYSETGQQTGQENPPMPMRKDGEPDFGAVTPRRAHAWLYSEESGLTPPQADDFVRAKIAEARQRQERANKAKTPKFGDKKIGTSIARLKAAEQERQQAIASASLETEYWNGVKAIEDNRKAEAFAAQQERDRAEGGRRAQTEERQKAQLAADRQKNEATSQDGVGGNIIERWNAAGKIEGNADEITLPDGEKVRGHYVLVESGAATPSHDANNNFHQNEGFPTDGNGHTVNDRDYEGDREAQQTTRDMADNYDSRAATQTPIVSRLGVVLSGNGRTMAGELAARQGTDTAYTDYLKEYGGKFGFAPEQVADMQHPRVLFVMDGDMPYTTDTFAKFNAQEMKTQSNTERAVKMGKIVDDLTYARIAGIINGFDTIGEFYSDDKATAGVVGELNRIGVINDKNMPELFNGDHLSERGKELIESVLTGKAFEGHPQTVRQLLEFPALRQKVVVALHAINDNITRCGQYSLMDELAEAINLVSEARRAGYTSQDTPSELSRQQNLFPDEMGQTVADWRNLTVLMLSEVMNDGRTTQLKKVLNDYNAQAIPAASGQVDMFAGRPRQKEEILTDIINRYGTDKQKDALLRARQIRQAGPAANTPSPAGSPANSGANTPSPAGSPANSGANTPSPANSPANSGSNSTEQSGDVGSGDDSQSHTTGNEQGGRGDTEDTSGRQQSGLAEEGIGYAPAGEGKPAGMGEEARGSVVHLTEEQAENLLAQMREQADKAPEIELTPDNWIELFGKDGIVETPIGRVKMGENQYFKLARQGRDGKLGMVKPTLEMPDVIIEDERASTNGASERTTSYIYVRAFNAPDGHRYYYFTSITVSKEGKEVVISNQERSKNRISKLLQTGEVTWMNSKFSLHPMPQSEESVPLDGSSRPTSTDNQPALLGINPPEQSEGKGTTFHSYTPQTKSEKVAEDNTAEIQKDAAEFPYTSVHGTKYVVTPIRTDEGGVRYVIQFEGEKDINGQSRERKVTVKNAPAEATMVVFSPNGVIPMGFAARDHSTGEYTVWDMDGKNVPMPEVENAGDGDSKQAGNPESTEGQNGQENTPSAFQYFTGSISDLIKAAKNAGSKLVKKAIAPVSKRLIDDLHAKGVDISNDYQHTLDNSAINHSLSRHASERERLQGQVPLSEDDFGRIGEIVSSYDEMTVAEGKGSSPKRILYLKHYSDGTTFFVEEIRNGRKELAAVSIRKYKNSNLTGETLFQKPSSNTPEAAPDSTAVSGGKGTTSPVTGKGSGKISDFGQKIGGSRKDQAQEALALLDKKTEKDIAAARKADEIFSKKHIEQLKEQGFMSAEAARILLSANVITDKVLAELRRAKDKATLCGVMANSYAHLVRQWQGDELPFRTISAEDLAKNLTNYFEALCPDTINYHNKKYIENFIEDWLPTVINTYAEVEGEGRGNLQYFVRRLGLRWAVQRIASHRGYGFSSRAEAFEKLRELCPVKGQKSGKGKSAGTQQADGHLRVVQHGWGYRIKSSRINGGIYFSNIFSNRKKAEAYLQEHAADLSRMEEAYAGLLGKASVLQVEREGIDYRQGRDVSEQEFQDRFGFRGVEFGNWVTQKERQPYLNTTYDAFMDLSAILGISPRALSLGGRLGLSFGGRGRGGNVLAHYEPAYEVINLTRTKGAGSLAHEWFHAVDNYLARSKSGNMTDYSTTARGHIDGMREELSRAFAELVAAIKSSAFDRRSNYADGEKTPYWSTTAEEAARAFSLYVEDKLEEKSGVSPMLTRKMDDPKSLATTQAEKDAAAQAASSWPYPTTEERVELNKAFDKLFDTIQEKTDPTGNVILFQRTASAEGSIVTEEQQAIVQGMAEWLNEAGIPTSIDEQQGQAILDLQRQAEQDGNGVRENKTHHSDFSNRRNHWKHSFDRAFSIITRKPVAEIKARRQEVERRNQEDARKMYDAVSRGEFNDVTLRLIDNYLNNVTPNNPYNFSLSRRLPAAVLPELYEGERTGSIDALVSRISESAIPASGKTVAERGRAVEAKKEEILKGWAQATGHWHTDIKDFVDDTNPIGSGKDSVVYRSKDGEHVIKVSKGKNEGRKFISDPDAVALYNHLFPDTRYKILGYGEIDGHFVRFLEQPAVDFDRNATVSVEDRVKYMAKRGFKPENKEKTAFSNGTLFVADIQKGNIVRDKAGNIRVIDADVKLHTKDIGGKYTIPPVEQDIPMLGVGTARLREMRGYHGSGADFDRFDHSHMGEGEGAQVHGWGTYVAAEKGTAEGYVEGATPIVHLFYDGRETDGENIENDIRYDIPLADDFFDEVYIPGSYYAKPFSDRLNEQGVSIEELKEELHDALDSVKERYEDKDYSKYDDVLQQIEERLSAVEKEEYEPQPTLYTVDIPDSNGHNYIEEDKTYKAGDKEVQAVKDALYKHLIETDEEGMYQGQAADELRKEIDSTFAGETTGRGLYGNVSAYLGSDKEASMFLNSMGYKGIHYNGRTDGDCYVIFNEDDLKITDKVRFFRSPKGEVLGFTVGGRIYLDPTKARPETPLHEYGHIWLEALKQGNRKEYDRLMKMVADSGKLTPVWEEIRRNYPEQSEQEQAEEVFVMYSGRQGARRIEEEIRRVAGDGGRTLVNKARVIAALRHLQNAIRQVWKGILDFLHIRYKDVDEAADQVLKDFINQTNPNEAVRRNTGEREDNTGDDGIRYQLGDEADTFEERQRRAVENKGTVMPGLNDESVRVVDVPRHSYTGDIAEATRQAAEAAKEKYAPNGEPLPLHYDNYGVEFDYTISGSAIDESLNPKQQAKSDNKGVHLAVVEHLDEVIGQSIEVEEHPDYLKNQNGDRDGSRVNNDALMHRFYGAINVDGQAYRVMTLMREDRNAGNGVHAYEVTKVEVLNEKSPSTSSGSHGVNSGLEPRGLISVAKLLEGVEKSYDNGKKILAESKKSAEAIAEAAQRVAERLGVRIKAVSSAEVSDRNPYRQQRKRAAKGWFDPRTGEIVVVLDNQTDAQDAVATVLHEGVAHYGLRQLVGDENMDAFLGEVYRNLTDEVRTAVDGLAASRYGGNRLTATEEYMASISERTDFEKMASPLRRAWETIKRAFRHLLDRLGLKDFRLDDGDLRYILWRSYQNLVGHNINSSLVDIAKDAAMRNRTGIGVNRQGGQNGQEAAGYGGLFRTSGEIERDYPHWLEGTTTGTGKHSTQVAGTRKTYNHLGDWIEQHLGKGVKILDASSGLGYGTQDLRQRGFNIEDVEPYQSEERLQSNPATYSSYDDVEGKYDYIISNAVLNVIPDDWRAQVLHDMAERLADGGRLFINTRKAGEERTIKDKIELDGPQEVLVKRNGRIASYQRFFTPQELKDWVQQELGDGYTVDIANEQNSGTKGLAAVVVRKSPDEPQSLNAIGATSSKKEVEAARQEVNTAPTDKQKEAGNYKKGHIKVDGYDITIENPKGSTRSGHDKGGKAWSIRMNYDYGYILGAMGVDGDHIDVYLSDSPTSGNVYVVDQINQQDGSFDEHKVMYGFPSKEAAIAAYRSQYTKGWKVGTVTEVSREDFKKWVDSSTRKTKPFSEYAMVKKASSLTADETLEQVNKRFNKDIDRYERGELPQGYRFDMGYPSAELRSAGFDNLPISMRASLLGNKAGDERHPFEASDLKDLVKAIQKPIAIFHYSKDTMRNLIVDATHGGKHFLVGVTLNYKANGIEINSVSGLFPKESHEWIKWIQDNKAIRIDQKEKVLDLIASLRTNPAESERIGLNLDSVAKVVRDFQNPKIAGEKSSGEDNQPKERAGIKTPQNSREAANFGDPVKTPQNSREAANFGDPVKTPQNSRKVANFGDPVKSAPTGNDNEAADDGILFRTGNSYNAGIAPEGGSNLARETYNQETTQNGAFSRREAMQDSMLGLKKLQDAIARQTGKPIKDYENAYMQEEGMSSRNLEQMNRYVSRYFRPLLDAISDLEQEGVEYGEVMEYMLAKHGIERQRELSVREALTDKEGHIDKQRMAQWAQRKQEVIADPANRTWTEQQGALDYVAQQEFGANLVAQDYAGLRGWAAAQLPDSDKKPDMQTAVNMAYQRIPRFERAHPEGTGALWKAVNTATKQTLRTSYEGGLMTKEAYKSVAEMYQYYVPMRGWADTTSDKVYDYLEHARPRTNSTLKTARGRTSMADDPVATIANMAQSTIVEANRNRLKQAFLNLVLNRPTSLVSVSKLWARYDDVERKWVPQFPDFSSLPADATGEQVGALVQSFNETMEALAKQDPDHYQEKQQRADIPYKVVPGMINEHQVVVSEGGKDYVLTVNGNPRAAQTLNGLTNPNATENVILQSAMSINRFMSANMTSRNPAFVLRNLVRDLGFSATMAYIKEGPRYVVRYVSNYARVFPKMMGLIRRYEQDRLATDGMDADFAAFMQGGGETGYTFIKGVDDYKKIIQDEKTWRDRKEEGAPVRIGRMTIGGAPVRVIANGRGALMAIAKALELFSRWAEDMARFSAFMTSRQEGRSTIRAIHDAKEISVNFNKKGAGLSTNAKGNRLWPAISELGRDAYIFWNAGVQGLNNVVEASRQHKGRAAKAAAFWLAAGLTAGMVNHLLQMLLGGDGDDDDDKEKEDEYYLLPPWLRRSNFCLYTGSGFIVVPLSVETRSVFGIGELTASLLLGHEQMTPGQIAQAYAAQVSQSLPIDFMEGAGGYINLLPSWVKPLAELHENKDWTGQPIYKETQWNGQEPEYQKAFRNTSPWLVSISKALNDATGGNAHRSGVVDVNPASLEHLWEGYLSGPAKFLDDVGKSFSAIWDEDMREFRNVPVVGGFYQNTRTQQNRERLMQSRYYERMDDLEATGNEYQGFRRDAMNPALTTEQRAEAVRKMGEVMQGRAYWQWMVMQRYRTPLSRLRKMREAGGSGGAKADSLYKGIMRTAEAKGDSLYRANAPRVNPGEMQKNFLQSVGEAIR